jgi:hypothetical protein
MHHDAGESHEGGTDCLTFGSKKLWIWRGA